ncbi:hypothetical protein LTR85_011992 [Meristemomyces frigidus]|nr:hypothetical protein LTR85_011992 [Meristemomyces frigidus]
MQFITATLLAVLAASVAAKQHESSKWGRLASGSPTAIPQMSVTNAAEHHHGHTHAARGLKADWEKFTKKFEADAHKAESAVKYAATHYPREA